MAFDLPGHGRSGATTPGCRGYDANPAAWIDDLDLMLAHMSLNMAPERGLPAFIYAESISGAATLRLLQRPSVASRLAGGYRRKQSD